MKNRDNFTLEELKLWSQVVVRGTSKKSSQSLGIIDGVRQITVSDLSVKKELLKAGIGWGRLPLHLIEEELRRGDLVDISRDIIKEIELEVLMTYSLTKPQGPMAKKFWQLFRESISKEC